MIAQIYMSVADACRRYGIGKTTLYQLMQYNECPEIRKLGHRTLIPVAEFDAFFESLLETPANYHGKEADEG